MSEIHLICVGRLRDQNLQKIEADYLKRINSPKLSIHETKNFEQVLKKIDEISAKTSPKIILLSEQGQSFDSPQFANWMEKLMETAKQIVFIIGGAEGHHHLVKNRANDSISLSQLTMPHQMARVIFVEQIYRSQTIRQGHPYHN